ncbi:hypothetical protein [Terrisporobacter petrolearius]|uniref:hypothetical protein n=1 Tax=Terrisporobacter petrolearius TaxID=1460447 RepID=UPI0022E41BAB|nr:hypothetical protein [Terrisporobacter petrolearius]
MRVTSSEEYQRYSRRHEHLEIYEELEFLVQEKELLVQDALLLMQIREQRELNRGLKQIENTLKKSTEKKRSSFYSIADM